MFDFLNQTQVVKNITGSFGEWLAKKYSKIRFGELVLHDILIDGTADFASKAIEIYINT